MQCSHLLLPAQGQQLVGVDEVAQVVEHAVLHERHLIRSGACASAVPEAEERYN